LDAAESLCRIQHEKAEREKALGDAAKLASKGLLLLSKPEDRLSINEAHDAEIQIVDDNGSKKNDEEIVDEQNKEVLDDGWKKVSRHENAKKRAARIEDDKAREQLTHSDC
jgi:hypothetical protein